MTDYESQTLAIAKQTLSAYIAADVVAAVALLAAIVGGVVAYRTMRALLEQLKIARWNSLLSFEQDMATRRTKFAEIGAQMIEGAPTKMLRSVYDEARESYFNSLDRLASSILNG